MVLRARVLLTKNSGCEGPQLPQLGLVTHSVIDQLYQHTRPHQIVIPELKLHLDDRIKPEARSLVECLIGLKGCLP